MQQREKATILTRIYIFNQSANLSRLLLHHVWTAERDTYDHTESSQKFRNSIRRSVWVSNALCSSTATLQIVQYAALLVIMGCHWKASASHLHQKASALQMENSLVLLSKQNLTASRVPGHPSYRTKKCR